VIRVVIHVWVDSCPFTRSLCWYVGEGTVTERPVPALRFGAAQCWWFWYCGVGAGAGTAVAGFVERDDSYEIIVYQIKRSSLGWISYAR
jgi:hypothetical protein